LRRQAYKDLESISSDYARLIASHIDSLESNPRPNDSKKLKGNAGYSLRVGTYRILYDIDDKTKLVTIYRIKHRREAYR
jgi:mRNA interferase RelE/StbE